VAAEKCASQWVGLRDGSLPWADAGWRICALWGELHITVSLDFQDGYQRPLFSVRDWREINRIAILLNSEYHVFSMTYGARHELFSGASIALQGSGGLRGEADSGLSTAACPAAHCNASSTLPNTGDQLAYGGLTEYPA
jgi:hypothetical protein